jgi:L-alanine-DL-glutamate epimerase-like enolase superfamily enzyme
MRITDVKTASVGGNFEWILVRVYTDEGLVGLGECYWGSGVEAIVRRDLKRLVEGEDPHNIDWLYQKMVRGLSGAGSTAGAGVAAISGVELALWDLKGKALNTPIYNLLGGRHRSRVRVYADCGHGEQPTPDSWAERAREALARGFTAIKFDIDNIDPARFGDPYHVGAQRSGWLAVQQQPLSSAELDLIVRLVGAVRAAIGPQIDLALDCHWSFNTRDAIRLATELAPFRLMWLEDPTPPDNVEALKRVTDNAPVPICSGENHFTRHGLREMITTQAVDMIQPDIPKAGGLLEAKKIADLADIYYIPLAAHNVSSPIGTLAACHSCASMRNFMVLEFHGQDVAWWNNLVDIDRPLIESGYITLPTGAGLGVALDEDVAQAHLRPGATFFA